MLTLLEKTTALQEPINQDLLTSMRSTGGNTLKGTVRPKQENNAIPRVAPKWLKHDRQVSVPPARINLIIRLRPASL
jgi:hypothetical protein